MTKATVANAVTPSGCIMIPNCQIWPEASSTWQKELFLLATEKLSTTLSAMKTAWDLMQELCSQPQWNKLTQVILIETLVLKCFLLKAQTFDGMHKIHLGTERGSSVISHRQPQSGASIDETNEQASLPSTPRYQAQPNEANKFWELPHATLSTGFETERGDGKRNVPYSISIVSTVSAPLELNATYDRFFVKKCIHMHRLPNTAKSCKFWMKSSVCELSGGWWGPKL